MKKIMLLVTLIMSVFMVSLTVQADTTDIVGPNVIHKQADHILTISNIKDLYSSPHGNVIVQSDEFTGSGNIIGKHQIVLKALDGQNEYLKDVSVFVVAELGNVKAVTDYKNLHVRSTQVLTPQEIVSTLKKTGYVEITATTQMMIINDTYTENSTVEGQYVFEFRLINSAGDDDTYSSIINVSDSDGFFVPDIVFEKHNAFIWLKKAWKNWVWPWIYNILTFFAMGIVLIILINQYRKKLKKGRG